MADGGEQTLAQAYAMGGGKWPVGYDAWEARAREVLEPAASDYVAGGAGTEATMRANLEAFYRRRLRPRMLRGTASRDLSVEVLGTRAPAPIWLAPVGVQSIMHEEGEMAVARAAAATSTPMVVSTAASTPMEDIATALGDSLRWYQLYWVNDREVVESLVRRAERSGYSAIVLTLDTLHIGWRDRDLRNAAFLPFLAGKGIAQFTSDPVFRSRRLAEPPEENLPMAGAAWVRMFPNLGLNWEDTRWLRGLTDLPLLAKGVLTAEDTASALDVGFDGVIVSNHGGRQVDGAVAALDALPEVRAAAGGMAVLMDSGVRRGSDVVKAVALGADAVMIGRPYAWGLAVGGQEGVEDVINGLVAELDLTMALVGAGRVADLDAGFLAPPE